MRKVVPYIPRIWTMNERWEMEFASSSRNGNLLGLARNMCFKVSQTEILPSEENLKFEQTIKLPYAATPPFWMRSIFHFSEHLITQLRRVGPSFGIFSP